MLKTMASVNSPISGSATAMETGKKKKGIAMVRLDSGHTAKAEIHWYEAHGIGKVKLKVKKWL